MKQRMLLDLNLSKNSSCNSGQSRARNSPPPEIFRGPFAYDSQKETFQ